MKGIFYTMAITNFIPTIWSESLYRALDKQYVAVANCNREFEGDIKECGSYVKICGVGSIDVTDYTKNTDMSNPQSLSDIATSILIDQAKCFNFQIDDIDKAQAKPILMDAAMKVAANALANEADKKVYSLYNNTNNIIISACNTDTILENIIKAREMLYNANVGSSEEVVLEVSPAVASVILKAKIDLASDNSNALENGYLGSFAGCKIYVSRNIFINDEEPDYIYNKCIMRTKRAIAFAEQLSEIEAYRPEKRFADAVKGLHLYGVKVVYPDEMVLLDLGTPIQQ